MKNRKKFLKTLVSWLAVKRWITLWEKVRPKSLIPPPNLNNNWMTAMIGRSRHVTGWTPFIFVWGRIQDLDQQDFSIGHCCIPVNTKHLNNIYMQCWTNVEDVGPALYKCIFPWPVSRECYRTWVRKLVVEDVEMLYKCFVLTGIV